MDFLSFWDSTFLLLTGTDLHAEHRLLADAFVVSGCWLHPTVRWALCVHGRYRKGQLANSAHASFELFRRIHRFQERRRCKEYIGWLLQQLKGGDFNLEKVFHLESREVP